MPYRVRKLCWYKMAEHISLIPGLILVLKDDGFILQFKFLRRHAGIYLQRTTQEAVAWQ